MVAHIIGFGSDCSGAVIGLYSETNTAGDGVGDGQRWCGSTSVPGLGTLSLLGVGLIGLGMSRRRQEIAWSA